MNDLATEGRMMKHTAILQAFDNLEREIARLEKLKTDITGEIMNPEKLPCKEERPIQQQTLGQFLNSGSETIIKFIDKIDKIVEEMRTVLF